MEEVENVSVDSVSQSEMHQKELDNMNSYLFWAKSALSSIVRTISMALASWLFFS